MAEQLTLGELIAVLEAEDLRTVVPDGFGEAHSYRGYYNDVGFEPARDVTVAQMLAAARRALGNTYEGYKGGEYTMREDTDCWLATWGACGEELTAERLRAMLDAGQTATAPANSIPIHGHMPPDADIETILADPGGACPDCVRIVIEGFRAEVKRLRKELDQARAERDAARAGREHW